MTTTEYAVRRHRFLRQQRSKNRPSPAAPAQTLRRPSPTVVPRGESTVVFRYHSRARSIGEVISLATLGGLALFALGATLRRRRTHA